MCIYLWLAMTDFLIRKNHYDGCPEVGVKQWRWQGRRLQPKVGGDIYPPDWTVSKTDLTVMALPRLLLLMAGMALASASLDSMLADSLDSCIGSQRGAEPCLRERVLDYLGAPRSGGESALSDRILQILKNHDLRVELPEALQSASLVFKPGRGLDFDIEFPHENDVTPRAGTYF